MLKSKTRKRLGDCMVDELNSCEGNVDREQEFIEEMIRLAVWAYMVRYTDAPLSIQAAVIAQIRSFTDSVVEELRQTLFHSDTRH